MASEWADQYKGVFDMGYERYREVVLARQKEMGIVPGTPELPPINPLGTPQDTTSPGGSALPPKAKYTRPWESLNED